MLFRQIASPRLAQYAYLIGCQKTREAIVVDPARDVDRVLAIAAAEGLRLVAATETHVHADFLSGVRELAESHGARAYLSRHGGSDWTATWPDPERHDVVRVGDGDTIRLGGVELRVVHTPGHTPEHLSFLVVDRGAGAEDAMGIATGDFVFVGSIGRPDLLETAAGATGTMEPAARALHGSALRFLELAEHLQVWPGHGAGSSCGKALGAVPHSTVGYERRTNPSLAAAREGADRFVADVLAGQPDPPLYFARMKRLNRDGPPLLGRLPEPERRSASSLDALASDRELVVLDTRRDRHEFGAGHLPGALWAPLDKSFPTVVGSFVEPGRPIHLLVEEDEREEALRELVRIGLDAVVSWFDAETFAEWSNRGGTPARIETVDFDSVARRRHLEEVTVLDVRGTAEFEQGHVPGALHVPHTRLLARRDEVPTQGEILVHCASGVRATASVALLAHLGHRARLVDGVFSCEWPRAEAARSPG